ncbi:MAG: hypothetical protein GYA33_02385, partial [Thermogutta sp.]|nr:hypothetical protein [Thermogutta sp.]
PTYLLRYKFRPGDVLQWRVTHRANVRTTVADVEEAAETNSISTKVWRIQEVRPDGSCVFEQSVRDVRMSQRLSGRNEVRFDSTSGDPPPVGFEGVAKTVGKPLARITLDTLGRVLHREQLVTEAFQTPGLLTVPLPEKPVAAGESWAFPYEVEVPLRAGTVKRIKVQQKFTLESVKSGLAEIGLKTVVLTPIDDPLVEVQLIQRINEGKVRFDIEAGRIVSQEMNLERSVVGFQGETSRLHYATRFEEEFVPGSFTAARPANTSQPE